MAKTTKYTYMTFANDAIRLAQGESLDNLEAFIEKANDLIATQQRKADYNKTHPKKSASKGASEATKENALAIEKVLTDTPMTAEEISKAIGKELSALQVSNAVKFIEGVEKEKVKRTKTDSKGLVSEKLYAAYFKA